MKKSAYAALGALLVVMVLILGVTLLVSSVDLPQPQWRPQ